MRKRYLPIALLVVTVAACSAIQTSMGRITVKDYTAGSGQRVMAGQAEPKAEYNCQQIAQENQEWGIAGNMNKVAATEKATSVAVDAAPGKGANYAYINIPNETSIMGFNIHAFSDAQIAYYHCANLPAMAK